MAAELDANVAWLLALAGEMGYKRALIAVTGDRSYLFEGKRVYMLYSGCPTKETARRAEKWNAVEVAWLTDDREYQYLERKIREYVSV